MTKVGRESEFQQLNLGSPKPKTTTSKGYKIMVIAAIAVPLIAIGAYFFFLDKQCSKKSQEIFFKLLYSPSESVNECYDQVESFCSYSKACPENKKKFITNYCIRGSWAKPKAALNILFPLLHSKNSASQGSFLNAFIRFSMCNMQMSLDNFVNWATVNINFLKK